MRLTLKVMTGLSAAAFLITGSFVMLGGMDGLAKLVSAGSLGNVTETDGYPLIDNVIRFSGALMFSVGLGFIYCFSDVQNKTVLFRFLLLAVFFGRSCAPVWVVAIRLCFSNNSIDSHRACFPACDVLFAIETHDGYVTATLHRRQRQPCIDVATTTGLPHP